MAVGVFTARVPGGGRQAEAQLLSSVEADTNGEWTWCEGIHPFTVEISGITSAEASIHGSNDEVMPANSDHGTDLTFGVHRTTDGMVVFSDVITVKWIKARITNYVTGTISARLVGAMS